MSIKYNNITFALETPETQRPAAQNGRHRGAHDDWQLAKLSMRKTKRMVTRGLQFCATRCDNYLTTHNNKQRIGIPILYYMYIYQGNKLLFFSSVFLYNIICTQNMLCKCNKNILIFCVPSKPFRVLWICYPYSTLCLFCEIIRFR